MVNKGGALRIIEAFVAVLIIVGAVLIVLQSKKVYTSEQFCNMLPGLIDEVSKNEQMRSFVMQSNETGILSYLNEKAMNPSFVFRVKICEPADPCALQEGGLDKIDICVEQRIISTAQGQEDFTPKRLKVFMFRV